jgi:hypothetical protein
MEIEFFFDDGGIFVGHAVIVCWNPGDGFHDADIAG